MNLEYTKLIILTLFVLNIFQFFSKNQKISEVNEPKSIESISCQNLINRTKNIELFHQIALKQGTDKVTSHHYEHFYGNILGPLRNNYINFLEIGLGCDVGYGPGKSIPLWKEFLPKVTISILEYNENCAKQFTSKVKNVFIGDQSDFKVLERVGKEGGPYDFIVDDGGHTRKQQINSVIGLWPHLNSKGVYVIEDIFTSFMSVTNDNAVSAFDLITELIILLNNPNLVGYEAIYPNITIREYSREISKTLLSLSCFERACILFKK